MAIDYARLKRIVAFIYDILISKFLTITAHIIMMNHMTMLQGSFLDVGTGTGAPLKFIIQKLKSSYSKIIGVDLHHQYTLQAQKRFQNDKSVIIYQMNFYDIGAILKAKFNFILFSFSFMLMPDQVNAIIVAKNNLQKNGKIAFVMTIFQSQNQILRPLKPLITSLTGIDFGHFTYQKQFEEVLKTGQLKLEKQVRLQSKYNLVLKIFPVYYVQTSAQQ